MRFSLLRPFFNTRSVRLTEQELQYLIYLASGLEASGFDEFALVGTGGGVQYVSLLYNDKVYELNYWFNSESEAAAIFERLVDELARLSPIPIDGGRIPHSP